MNSCLKLDLDITCMQGCVSVSIRSHSVNLCTSTTLQLSECPVKLLNYAYIYNGISCKATKQWKSVNTKLLIP